MFVRCGSECGGLARYYTASIRQHDAIVFGDEMTSDTMVLSCLEMR